MTNKDYLADLYADDFYDVICWLWFDWGRQWTDTRIAIIQWLNAKYNEETFQKEWKMWHFDKPFNK